MKSYAHMNIQINPFEQFLSLTKSGCHFHNGLLKNLSKNVSTGHCDLFVDRAMLEANVIPALDNRWKSGLWLRSSTRGSGPCKLSSYGLDVDLDISPLSCAAACASLGLPIALLHGDRVNVKRSAGRILELQEEAVVLGAYQGRLFYRIVSQKSEGGSLTEGGGRSWFWDESEAVDDGLKLIGDGLGLCVPLPKMCWFAPQCGGLKVIYPGGAVGEISTHFPLQALFHTV